MVNHYFRIGIRAARWALATQIIACSSSDANGTNGGAGGAAASGGAAGNAGASTRGGSSGGATAGGAGNGGTGSGGRMNGTGGSATGGLGAGGSSATLPCPGAPPAATSACKDIPDSCFYEDCGGVGRVSARCTNGEWVVETGPCGATACGFGSTLCTAGQACVERIGGAFLTDCTATHCKVGPVQCDCIDGCYPGCFVAGSVSGGIVVSCNTCPSGQCP